MLILYALLIVSASLSALTDGSAIKGHARPHEDARSIKLASASNTIDKAAKVASAVPASPSVPILESSKRIYNDESIRRLTSGSVAAAPPAPVELAAVASPIKPIEQVLVAPKSPEPAPVQQQQAPVVVSPVVVKPEPVSVVPQQSQPVPVQPVEQAAVIEPKSAAPVLVAQPAKPAPVDELPAASDRSAPIRQEVPVIQPASVVVSEQVVRAPVVEQPVAVVAAAPAPVQPVVKVESNPAPIVEPAVVESGPLAKEAVLQAKKEEVAPVEAPLHIEVPAPDPGLILSEPIDSTTKLLIDLDEHVQKFLPADEQQLPAQPQKDQSLIAGVDYSPASQATDPTGKSSGPLVPYSSVGAEEPIVPPLPSLEGVEKASAGQAASGVVSSPSSPSSSSSSSSSSGTSSATRQGNGQHQNQQQVITQLLDQLDTLQNRIQDTINQLVARRRYVMSALLRPMGTYVRRVRTNLERLQNRVNQLQAAAVSVGGGQNRPGGFVDAAAIETIRRRIDDISKRISDIVNRIRFSLTPTSAPMNSNGRK